jgi:retron-type reverse transcriptase
MANIDINELFQAYYDCRKNKRNTTNALAFEMNYESNLLRLYEEINNGTYTPSRSIAFIVQKPVKREVFAAGFRDRVVHHYIINKLNPLFEKQFIYDSYSCRVGKGTHFGIRRINKFIRQRSNNYTKDAYILKLDIEGFFMHINKNILFNSLQKFINTTYCGSDKQKLLELCKKIIFNNPIEGCVIKGNKSNWNDLPKTKSLFYSPANCGLPIGNLTSQIFANFYLNAFDHYIKHDLGIRFYGRYVDDFVIVHTDKEHLKSLIPIISDFLCKTLGLTLHPKKRYLQHFSKGVAFLGVVIKPHRIYVGKRTKGNFYKKVYWWNCYFENRGFACTKKSVDQFLSSINSYLGIMSGGGNTYKLRRKIISETLSQNFKQYISYKNDYKKVTKNDE